MTNVIPTNQQEETISTITELTTYVQFTPDTEVNKRLKVAQMAKQFNTNTGVMNAQVGYVSFHVGDTVTGSHREVVQVSYSPACEEAVQEAKFPLYVTRAWFTKDELYGVEFSITGEEATHVMYTDYYGHRLQHLAKFETLTINGKEHDERDIRELIHASLRYDGDQHGNALSAIADRKKNNEKRQQHDARVQAAYAEREASGGHYRTAWVLEKAQGGLAAADEDGWKKHREALNQAYKALVDCYNVELWAIVEENLGKLRCETSITNGDDPYGFVTIAEVAYHILYKWVNNGYWDSKEVRHVVASEFVRNHLS